MSNYVYIIVNKKNLKLYFGSHSWDGEGLDPNYYGSGTAITRAVKKYGKENFIVYPIKFFDNVDECRRAEEELLTKYDIANNQYCYNIKNGAIGWTSEDIAGEKHPQYGKRGKDSHNYGKHFSDEHRKNLSQSQNYRKTPIVAIQKDTGKVKIFESQRECARKLKVDRRHINHCLKGRRNHTGGYSFKYVEELDSGIYEGIL